MQTQTTINEIRHEMETLFRNVAGRPELTANEADIVDAAIIDAFQEVLLEYGMEDFRFQEVSATVDTTSGTRYVDLDEYIYRVVPGSLRVSGQSTVLSLIDEQEIFALDPDLESTGLPQRYARAVSDDPNVMRLILYPIPDAAYTLNFTALKYPSDAITNFPIALCSAIKYKAKGLACMQLGIGQLKPQFDAAYENIITKVKDSYQAGTPKHVGRRVVIRRSHHNEE